MPHTLHAPSSPRIQLQPVEATNQPHIRRANDRHGANYGYDDQEFGQRVEDVHGPQGGDEQEHLGGRGTM